MTIAIAIACLAAALISVVTIGTDADGEAAASLSRGHEGGSGVPLGLGAEHSPGPALISTSERVQRHEALPCTGPKDPINFEIFSAGPLVAGVPLTDFKRRCGGTAPPDKPPANFTNYFYGNCKIAKGATGCASPLQVQTWPACQRAFGDYSYAGRPIPHRELPKIDGAEVVLIEFMFEPRIEVYTGSTTIVIFAENSDLAKKALTQLKSQKIGTPPAMRAEELKGEPDETLAEPTDGATEGELQCQS